jgi:hypothetical protein
MSETGTFTFEELVECGGIEVSEWENATEWCAMAWKLFAREGLATFKNRDERCLVAARFESLGFIYSDFWYEASGLKSSPDIEGLLDGLDLQREDLLGALASRQDPKSRSNRTLFRAICDSLRNETVRDLKNVFGGLTGLMQSLLDSLPGVGNFFCDEEEFEELQRQGADISSLVAKFSSDMHARISRWVGEGCPPSPLF